MPSIETDRAPTRREVSSEKSKAWLSVGVFGVVRTGASRRAVEGTRVLSNSSYEKSVPLIVRAYIIYSRLETCAVASPSRPFTVSAMTNTIYKPRHRPIEPLLR